MDNGPAVDISPANPDRTHVLATLDRFANNNATLQFIGISGTNTVNGVTYYQVLVANENLRWSLAKRFQDFAELNTALENRLQLPATLPPFPDKAWKAVTDHTDHAFITMRRVLLENYLKKVLNNAKLRTADVFVDFLKPAANDECKTVEAKDLVFEPRERESKSPRRDLSDLTRRLSETQSSSEEASGDLPEVTAVSIPAAQVLKKDHVVYQINVENLRRRKSFSRWTVLKRFVHFRTLDETLRTVFAARPDLLAKLPPLPYRQSKWLVDHLQRRFIEKRRLLLQVYLELVIAVPEFVSRPEVLTFLGVVDSESS